MDTMQRLRDLAAERGVTVYRLAQESGVAYSTVRMSGKRGGQLSLYVIERFCQALGISLAEFFASEEERRILRAGREMLPHRTEGNAAQRQ